MQGALAFELGETADMLRDAVRRFADQEIAPQAAYIDKTNQFPLALWPKMGELGLLGITVSEKYGGSGMGYLHQVIAMEEMSRASAAVGFSYIVHANLCVNHLFLHGSEVQKARYLPPMIRGDKIGALAMSESNAGSDVIGMQLRADKTAQGYCLNGSKMWITNGPDADVFIVYAKTDKDAGSKGITAFIVEKTYPGFKAAQKLDKLGMRGSNTCELVFNDCEVPEENVLGSVNEGVHLLMQGLNHERMVLAAGPVGIMQACLDVVLPYVHQREQFGKPIGEFQFIQGKIADMYTHLSACRAYLYTTVQHCDKKGGIDNKDAAAVLLFCAEKATQMALEAIQCLGGNGYINEFPTGRFLRDAKLYEIGAGTSEIRRLIVGRELFKKMA